MKVALTLSDNFFAELHKSPTLWPMHRFVTRFQGQWVQDEHTPRPYLEDDQGRRWLLDGSGDVA